MIISVERATDTAEVRRQAATLAGGLGYDAEDAGRVSIVATELATNIVKHAGRGELVVQPYRTHASPAGVELIAIDTGPGIADLSRARADGYSTAGSPGTGLGAIQRLASVASMFTRPGQGTVSLARLARRGRMEDGARVEIAAVEANCPGESVCGDAWAATVTRDRWRLIVVDGSGHGEAAAAAARAAIKLFEAKPGLGLVELATALHRGLGHTRGAAGAFLEIDLDAHLVRFAGLGNISGTLITRDGRRGMISANGTLGHAGRSVKEFTYPYEGLATIVLHSDGIATRWQLDAYPGLESCHAGVIAGVLYRDFRRGRDDATVVVAKVRP